MNLIRAVNRLKDKGINGLQLRYVAELKYLFGYMGINDIRKEFTNWKLKTLPFILLSFYPFILLSLYRHLSQITNHHPGRHSRADNPRHIRSHGVHEQEVLRIGFQAYLVGDTGCHGNG